MQITVTKNGITYALEVEDSNDSTGAPVHDNSITVTVRPLLVNIYEKLV